VPPVSVPPSGEQVTIRAGGYAATIVEVGGGLRALEYEGAPLVDGYAEDEMCSGGRGQPLLPWPNRIADGRYRFAERDRQLALTEPERGNAIHGLARWANWQTLERTDSGVVMSLRLHPQPGYPHPLELGIEYELSEDGLAVLVIAANLGDEPAPFGAGAHPYLAVGDGTVDGAELTLPAATALSADDRGLPTGHGPVEGTPIDFRAPRAIGGAALDTCFTDLARDDDGLARVRLAPGGGLPVTLWMDAAWPYVMAFTGDTLDPERRRRGLAVEPMTCPPNAFATREDLWVLEAGEAFTGEWGIQAG
jgi:aldose 1-epimerase